MPQTSEKSLLSDPRLIYGAATIFFVLGFVRRAFLGHVPGDFTAYLHAADLFVDGANPYTDARFSAARYDGFPYNYFPGTLYVIAPLAWLPTAVATTLDWLVRGGLIIACVRVFGRVFPAHHAGLILLVMLAHEPFLIDVMVGNIVTYLFAAYVGLLWVSTTSRSARGFAVAVLAGVAFAFKPFWYIPAGFLLASRGRWKELAAAIGGTVAVLSLSFLHRDWAETFAAHTETMRGFYTSIDFFNLVPSAYPFILVAGVLVGAWLLAKRPSEDLWLLGCVSMPVWPRLATYSYALTIPFVLWLMARFGPWRGALLSVAVIGPLPWLARDSGILPSTQAEGWLLFIWTCCAALLLTFHFARGEEPTHA